MSEAYFSVGDVVVLKSGGPRMTIQRIYGVGTVDYNWDEIDVVWFFGAMFNSARVAEKTLKHWRLNEQE